MAGLSLCLWFNTLFATTYKGRVTDEAGNPLEFANVALMSVGDSTLIDGAVTDEAGIFAVNGNGAPAFLRVSAMGFEERRICNPGANVGDIVMTAASYMLGEVVVKGARPVARLKGDGVQVTVAGTYLADTGTALEVLGKMPFVIRTGKDVEVLGKGTPLVFINGRQVRDMSELERLASSQIKSVDVVTSPGARYASTVNAVVRITTVSPVGEGFSLNDRTVAGYKHYAYLFEQVDFNWRKSGLDIFGMLNYENYRERPGVCNSTTQYLKSGLVEQTGSGRDFAIYPVYQGKTGLNYSRGVHNLGFFYDFSFRPSTISGGTSADRYVDSRYSESLENFSDLRRHDRQHLLSGYYSGEAGKWRLSANFDALWQINDCHNVGHEVSSVNERRDFATVNDVTNRLLAGNVAASIPMWRGLLRFGAEASDIRRTDWYAGNADFIAGSDVKIAETTLAAFAEMEQSFGVVSASVGLRWEYTDSKYWQSGQLSSDQSRDYHNLAPSASLSFPIGNVNTRLSYMRRITRPAFGQLSSAVRYIDRYSYESGNPSLRPVCRDYVSASASWRDLLVELEYCSTNNYFLWQTSEYEGGKDVTLQTMVNMPRFGTYGAYVSYSPTFFGCWHPSFMAGINAQDFKMTHAGESVRLDRPLGIFRFDNAVRLPWDIWLNVDISARTAGNGDNYYMEPYWQCDLGLYKSFAGDTWSVKLQLNDVFDSWRQEMTLYDGMSRIWSRKVYDTRDLSLTLRYNFNSARSRYKGSGAGNTDKGRL